MTEPKDPITLLVENPNLAFCAMMLQVVSFTAALSANNQLQILSIVLLICVNTLLLIVFGRWVLTGGGFE